MNRVRGLSRHFDPMLKSRDNLPIISTPVFARNVKGIKRAVAYENSVWLKRRKDKQLSNNIQKRALTTSTGQNITDPTAIRDFVIILPETQDSQVASLEINRVPKRSDQELDFSKINPLDTYRGFSNAINKLMNFLEDTENDDSSYGKSTKEFFELIEKNIYPIDSSYNVISLLTQLDSERYQHVEILKMLNRYRVTREKRTVGVFGATIDKFMKNFEELDSIDRSMVLHYCSKKLPDMPYKLTKHEVELQRTNLRANLTHYMRACQAADHAFVHIVDDPDILSQLSSDFDDVVRHKERTPLKIRSHTYKKFMRLCPDRFVRQQLWQLYIRRCSPKDIPKRNNSQVVNQIQAEKRLMAESLGYRNHLDRQMRNTMAKKKTNVITMLTALNEENLPKVDEKLRELNDYASNNAFYDPDLLGVQEYDIDYWSQRYVYDVVIGMNEHDVKSFFPLESVLSGIESFSSRYLGVKLQRSSLGTKSLWCDGLIKWSVIRNSEIIGSIILDPFLRDNKACKAPTIFRVRSRSNLLDTLPMHVISTNLRPISSNGPSNLSLIDINNLFSAYGIVLQSLLYNYRYYELNVSGAIETDAKLFLSSLVALYLRTDYRVIQCCSNRGGSKNIDANLASRLIRAQNYFNPMTLWKDLYLAHLDLEINSGSGDVKVMADNIHKIYSPFSRSPDDYDYCAMPDIIVGPHDGNLYAGLWSQQLAHGYLKTTLGKIGVEETYAAAQDHIKQPNEVILDHIADPNGTSMNEKLQSVINCSFEPSKASLSML